MKTTRNNLLTLIVPFTLCVSMTILPACKEDEEADMNDDNLCEQQECLNGGSAIRDVELGGCRCICPAGYSGENCGIKDPE